MCHDEQLSSAIGLIVKGHADLGKDITGWDGVPDTTKDFCYARLAVSKLVITINWKRLPVIYIYV